MTKTIIPNQPSHRNPPEVDVVIVSYNTAKLTQQAIDSVLASTGVTVHVWVVDNASVDRTASLLRRRYNLKVSRMQEAAKRDLPDLQHVSQVLTSEPDPQSGNRVSLLLSLENLGFGRANNLAAALSTAEFLWFFNSDAVAESSALSVLLSQFQDANRERSSSVLHRLREKIDNLGVVAPELHNTDGSLQRQGGNLPTLANIFAWITFLDDIPWLGQWGAYQHHDSDMKFMHKHPLTKVGWVGGTALLVRRACFDEVGGFDQAIFMYGEDVELCWRATKRHWDVAMATRSVVTHIGSASSGHKRALLGEISSLLYFWQKHRSPLETWMLQRVLRFGLYLRIVVFGILKRYGQQRIYQEALELV